MLCSVFQVKCLFHLHILSFLSHVALSLTCCILARSIKTCAAAWEMNDVMWMFQPENEDTESDVKLMLEHRGEVADFAKLSEKIVGFKGGTDSFNKIALQLKSLAVRAKERLGPLMHAQ